MNTDKGKDIDGIDCDEIHIPSKNGGDDIRIRVYKPQNITGKLPVMVYLHGDGYMAGCLGIAYDFIKGYIEHCPCIVVAPAYRLALQQLFPVR